MKGTKVILIIALLLLLVGVVAFFAAWASAGFDFSVLFEGGERTEHNETLTLAPGEALTVEIPTGNVLFGVSSDTSAHFRYFDTEKMKFTLTHENGEAKLVRHTDFNHWYDFLHFDFMREPVTILLPSDFSGNINITATTGDMTLSGISGIKDFSVTVTTGKVVAERISADNITVVSTTGDTVFTDTNCHNNLSIMAINGKLRVDNLTVGGTLTADTTNGDMNLTDVTVTGAVSLCSSGNGKIIVDCFTGTVFSAETTTGDIRFDEFRAETVSLKATTGDIKGEIVGNQNDYRIESSTNTGRNNLPSSWDNGEKPLRVKTTTGNIKIEFVQ